MKVLPKTLSILKTVLKKQIDISSAESLLEVRNHFYGKSEKQPPKDDKVQIKLSNIVCKPVNTDRDRINLRSLFIKHWNEISQDKKLTKALIQYFEHSCTYNGQFLVQHKNGDSRLGYYFEDKFAEFLRIFLDSRLEVLDKKQRSQFDVLLNEYIPVPGFQYRQKPDILITRKKPKEIRFIGELKKGFSKSTLKHVYRKQRAKWENFRNAKFLLIIFDVNLSKVKVYKQNEGCRIICSGLRKNKEQLNNRDIPVIHDGIENVFMEILQHLKTDIKTPKNSPKQLR